MNTRVPARGPRARNVEIKYDNGVTISIDCILLYLNFYSSGFSKKKAIRFCEILIAFSYLPRSFWMDDSKRPGAFFVLTKKMIPGFFYRVASSLSMRGFSARPMEKAVAEPVAVPSFRA